ncbi:MAG: hypothetical protein HYT76_01200 [Deltaproteobacteria bacterium]|nr:hypothetical protein [Deltaproteobacteria bacterium]
MIIIFGLLFFISCGSVVNQGENYGNLLDSPEGLALTESEHEIGWGRSDCTTCHNLDNIHLIDRTGGLVDIEVVHDHALQEGVSGCAACHGTNGAP